MGRSILQLKLCVSITDQSQSDREKNMANVYIEARPEGSARGSPYRPDYVVEDHSDHVLATFKTQREAIDWAIKNGQRPGSSGSTGLIPPLSLGWSTDGAFSSKFPRQH